MTDDWRCCHCSSRKSSSWHASLRIRKKSEKKEKEVKKESKLENGYRKSRDGTPHKVSVKVSVSSLRVSSSTNTSDDCLLFPASKPKLHL